MAIIPAITTGIIDFIISSGRITDMAAIPVPDFAVPYAAPSAVTRKDGLTFYMYIDFFQKKMHTYHI